MIDKNSILWKDFIAGVKRRKALVQRLRDAAIDSASSMNQLKRQLLDVRNLTLTLIEDALEIEYRYQIFDPNSNVTKASSKPSKLPPISSFRSMEEKEDVYALAEIINDVDVLFSIPNIRVMLPRDFPNTRNPFLLGKTVDELADLVPPNPEAGNLEEELKVLELLRYKRASRALIRAEAQILNNLPLTLHEVERFLVRMADDINIEKLTRVVCTLLDNDRTGLVVSDSPDLRCLLNPIFNIEGYDLLARLNRFKGTHPMRVDVQVVVRQHLQECNFDYLEDNCSRFLLDWINLVLSQSVARSRQRGTDGATVASTAMPRNMYELLQPGPVKKEPHYDDLASEVSSANYNRGTHEGIFNEPPPRMKMMRASSPALGGVRPRTNSDDFGTGPPISVAIQAGRKAAQQSGRPNSRNNARSPSQGVRPLSKEGGLRELGNTSPKALAGTYLGAEILPPLHTSSSDGQLLQDYTALNTNVNAVVRQKTPARTPLSQGGGGGGRKLNAAQKQVEAQEAAAKMRAEIEKVVRQMGLATAKKGKNGMLTKDEEDLELDRLSSVRYELHRMQQELLRRQVLDPRHYQVMSVDAIAQAQSGLTVSEINTFSPDETLKQKLVTATANAHKLVALAEKVVSSTPSRDGTYRNNITIELLLDLLSEVMVARINSVQESGGEEVTSNQSIISGVTAVTERKILSRETLAHTKISRLIFNRLSDFIFGDLPMARKDMKGKMLQNIFDLLHQRALEIPPLSGFFFMQANRVLMTHKFTEDGVLVDLVILRNDECDGLIIHCTPLAGIYNAAPHTNAAGPVTIHIHDKELQVLLINQYGMYILSRSKWSSMEMVAQWLSGRLVVRKVKALDTTTTAEDGFDEQAMAGDVGNLILDEPSFVSQVTFDNTAKVLGPDGVSEKKLNLETDLSSPVKSSKMPGFMDTLTPQRVKTPSSALRPGTSQQSGRPRVLAMLDVQLDRRVDVSSTLQLQWKSRNVPNISGMEMIIHAWQDLEILVIKVSLTLPLPHRFNLLKRKKRQAAKKGDNLLDMADYSDDEEMTDEQFGQVEPVTIELMYRLTSAELSIFGSAEMIEQKKITLSQNVKIDAEQQHPETFIWNVFSRLKVFFKVSVFVLIFAPTPA